LWRFKGQIHGGVAQGLGQALMEQVVYDRQSGQNLTGSFMDYCMPRADTMPYMEITSNPVPTNRNPLGAKGAGEAGTAGALPAIVNAVVDALAPLGVKASICRRPASESGRLSAMRVIDPGLRQCLPPP
jgi:carbon-monoxide dehydrogenase large subunit